MSKINYARFIGRLSAARKPSIIREMTKLLASAPKDVIPLSGGLPNPIMFPFVETIVKTSDKSTITITGEDMKAALQYQSTNGIQELVDRLRDLQIKVHSPPRSDWELVTTSGCQDALCKAIDMLLAGEPEGEPVLVEDFIYAATIAMMEPYNPKYLVVESDENGLRSDRLREVIESCDLARRPRFIYVNPTGANPTGKIITEQRKREIYQICCEHDILILEDDPYYFMQFDNRQEPSFFSMDTEGRVLRFDSFSKILSSGLRLGFATGPKPLIDRIVLHMQVTTVQASSLSQVIAIELMKKWGDEGFFKHIEEIKDFYQKRRDDMVAAADKHLTGLCTWEVPAGGMFLWMDVPGVPDTWDMIMEKALEKKVMLLPGKAFSTDQTKPSSRLRAAYSMASADKMDEAFRRLAELIREEQQRLSAKK